MIANDLKISVLGAGSWGTALAGLLASKGYDVTIWAYEDEVCRQINEESENSTYLPGFKLPENLKSTNSIEEAILSSQLILSVMPSHVVRGVLSGVASLITPDQIFVSATKGIEIDTLMTNSQIVEEVLPGKIADGAAYISGPSFAREVAAQLPTAVTVASKYKNIALKVQEIFSTPYFRVYSSSDIIGLEVGGSIKNVIALGAGISDGLGFGYNARAALITRGLAEMTRLGLALGAKPSTFSGLSGMGDLVLTCTGDLSRNRSVGIKIGEGKKIDEILSDMNMVAEGVKTAKAAYLLAEKLGINMPICESIYKILYEDMEPKEAVSSLMTRDLKEEVC